jgi:hypothetical protein
MNSTLIRGVGVRTRRRSGAARDVRNLSRYETFELFHATTYQHVEALSVTPFADRITIRLWETATH